MTPVFLVLLKSRVRWAYLGMVGHPESYGKTNKTHVFCGFTGVLRNAVLQVLIRTGQHKTKHLDGVVPKIVTKVLEPSHQGCPILYP